MPFTYIEETQQEKPSAKFTYLEQGEKNTDERARQFNPQLTKGLYEHLPFGKRIIKTVDSLAGTNMAKEVESIPPAEGFSGKAGKFSGDALAFAPAFEAGAAMTPFKLAGGALGVGTQTGQEAINRGEKGVAPLKDAVISGGGTFVGGKVLEGIGNGIYNSPQFARDVSGRMHDFMVKVPTKAFNYGKDPLAVMQKEGITANSMTDYAQTAHERLSQRSSELEQAVKDSDQTIDVSKIVDGHLESASNKLSGSLKDRTSAMKEMDTFKEKLLEKYGDLKNISVPKAIKLKQQLADDYPFTRENSTDINAKAAHKIYHDVNEAVETVHPEISELNQRVSSLIDISKAAQNRVAIEARNNPIGLIHTLLGVGAGAATGHGVVEGAGIGITTAVLSKAMSSPAVLTRVANTLSKLSEVDRINLYKSAPWFMDVAEKAHDFVKGGVKNLIKSGESLGMAGEVGSRKNIVEPNPLKLGLPSPVEVPSLRTVPKYAQKDPTLNAQGLPIVHDVIPMRGATTKNTVDLSIPNKTTRPSTARREAQIDMSKGGQDINKPLMAGGTILSASKVNGNNQKDGKQMTKEFEGFRSSTYKDTKGKNTIGYGFNIDDPSIKKLLPSDVINGRRSINKEEADKIFNRLYIRANNDAKSFIGQENFNKLSKSRQDILTDMSYNLGKNKLDGFRKFRKALLRGDYESAADEMRDSDWHNQVKNRAVYLENLMRRVK